jgi:hypothetical protein
VRGETAGSCEIHINAYSISRSHRKVTYPTLSSTEKCRSSYIVNSTTDSHMSSYGARPIEEGSRVPAQSQIAVTLLLPADDSPAFFSKDVREWQEKFLTGSQTYTLDPVPAYYGQSGLTQPPETVRLPVCRLFAKPTDEADIAVQQGVCQNHFPSNTIRSNERLLS